MASRKGKTDAEKVILSLASIEKELRELRFMLEGQFNDINPKVDFLYQLWKRRS